MSQGKGEDDKQQQPVVRLRNYIPEGASRDGTGAFEHERVPAAKAEAAPLDQGTARAQSGILADVAAPKKANWDLKKDVAANLQRLERRTQDALVELAREEEERRQEALLKQA